MPRNEVPILELDDVEWEPVGPLEDPDSHLMALIVVDHCSCVMHAVEVDPMNRSRMTATAPKAQYIIDAIETIIGLKAPMRMLLVNNRTYVVVIVPNIDGSIFQ